MTQKHTAQNNYRPKKHWSRRTRLGYIKCDDDGCIVSSLRYTLPVPFSRLCRSVHKTSADIEVQKNRIYLAIIHYLREYVFCAGRISPAKEAALISRLANPRRRRKSPIRLNPPLRDRLESRYMYSDLTGRPSLIESLNDGRMLDVYEHASKLERQNMKPLKRGRTSNDLMNELVGTIASAYEILSGKKATYNPYGPGGYNGELFSPAGKFVFAAFERLAGKAKPEEKLSIQTAFRHYVYGKNKPSICCK